MTPSLTAYAAALCVAALAIGTQLGIVIGVRWCRKYEHPVVYDTGVTDGHRAARGMERPPKVSE